MNHLKVMPANAAMKEVKRAMEADTAPPRISIEKPVETNGGFWDIFVFLIFIGAVFGFTKFKRDTKKKGRASVPSTPRKGVTFSEDDDNGHVAASPRAKLSMGHRSGSNLSVSGASNGVPPRSSAVSSASSEREPSSPFVQNGRQSSR